MELLERNRNPWKSAESHGPALKACSVQSKAAVRARKLRKPPFVRWWRGLDSNQRTLARADLQSAAFNHSATSPRGQAGAPCGEPALMCQRAKEAVAPLGYSPRVRSNSSACPRHAGVGAGEGNRTLVVSLEGFCSTIELHPQLLNKAKPRVANRWWRGKDSNLRRREVGRFTVCCH